MLRTVRRTVTSVGTVLTVFVGSAVIAATPATAIQGGQIALGDSVVVALIDGRNPTQPFCTGALIEPRVILTAGHCLVSDGSSRSFPQGLFIAPPGVDVSTDNRAQRARALSWWWPSSFTNPSSDSRVRAGDIAVVVIDRRLGGGISIASAEVAAELQRTQAMVTHLGYGTLGLNVRNDGSPRQLAQRLRTASSPRDFERGSFFQTQGTPSANICPGDSGGPVIATVGGQRVLLGVQAGGDTICAEGYSGGDNTVGFIASFYSSLLDDARNYFANEPPSEPRQLASVAVGGRVLLTWDAPADGAPTTGYVVERQTLTGRAFMGVELVDDTNSSGPRIQAVIAGTAAAAAGLPVNARIVAIGGTTVRVTADVRSLLAGVKVGDTLILDLILSNGSARQVTLTLGETLDATPAGQACTTAATVLTCTIEQADTRQRYRVYAQSARGNGQAAEIDVTMSPISAPTNPQVRADGRIVTVTWSTPANLEFLASDTSVLVSSTTASGCQAPLLTGQCTFTSPAGQASISAIARTPVGDSPPASWGAVTVASAVPDAVRSAKVRAVRSGWVVSWQAPTDNGGLPIQRFVIVDSKGKTLCRTTATSCSLKSTSTKTRALIRVQAVNARGSGKAVSIRLP
jgi:V8-like Glu-specific endopeptidase